MLEEWAGVGIGAGGYPGAPQLHVQQPSIWGYGQWSVTCSEWRTQQKQQVMGSWAGSELSACYISGIGVGELAQ